MLKRLKKMYCMTVEIKHQSVSMRRRLTLYWLCMALGLLAVLLLILNFVGFFSNSAKKLNESLMIQQQNTKNTLEDHMDSLEAGCLTLSKMTGKELTDFLFSKNIKFEDLDNNPETIVELEQQLYMPLNTFLQSSKCSGAFIVLDATCNTEVDAADTSRMGIYLRYSDLSSINAANKHVVYFRGASEVARAEAIPMHNRWNLEFKTDIFPGYESGIGNQTERLADQCYWSERLNLLDTWEDAVLLCVPIEDNYGTIRGICGVELSSLYFNLAYPATSGSFGNMIIAAAPVENNCILMDKAMIGSSDDRSLRKAGSMIIQKEKYYNKYTNGETTYLGLHQILPTKLSSGRSLALVTLIPEDNYKSIAASEKQMWYIGLIVFLILMFFASKSLANHFTMPIAKAFSDIQQDLPLNGHCSGISELDELVDYLYHKNKDNNDKELPPNIEELFDTFKMKVESLTPMERTVLQYYIEGLTIEEVAEKAFISINTAKKHNTNINRKLGISRREELMLYIDLFRRCGRLEEITYHG